jgi:DNA-binding MarR family transcriptional regulator
MTIKNMGRAHGFIEHARGLYGRMEIQMLAILLEVANQPDISITELSGKCGLSDAACSRNVTKLSDGGDSAEGLALVERHSVVGNKRKKKVTLTEKGKDFVEKLLGKLD